MKAVLQPDLAADMPAVRDWLVFADQTRRIVEERYGDRSKEARLEIAIEENVLVQIENLRTHPRVAEGLAAGKLRLHGWIYKIGSGEVFDYDPWSGQFEPLVAPERFPLPFPLPAENPKPKE